jgi:hypothetical protein
MILSIIIITTTIIIININIGGNLSNQVYVVNDIWLVLQTQILNHYEAICESCFTKQCNDHVLQPAFRTIINQSNEREIVIGNCQNRNTVGHRGRQATSANDGQGATEYQLRGSGG